MPIAITAQTASLLDKPYCYPARLVIRPLLWVIAKVRRVFEVFFGFFVRLAVFPFGESNHSYIKRKIIETYKGGCYDTHRRLSFDPFRLEQAFGALEEVGGIRYDTFSKDGTKLDAMIIRYRDVKEKIEQKGGKIIEAMPVSIDDVVRNSNEKTTFCRENHSHPEEYIDVILPEKTGDPWDTFDKVVLSNLGFEKVEIQLKNGKVAKGFIFNHWNEKRPIRPKQGQCFIRANAPTESYAMAKRDIMRRVLGTKNDALCFDYRGTWKSEGAPSEGGYYLDAETMVEQAVSEFGYNWKDIWAEGFCLGGAVAMHLKEKYFDKGINLFLQNTFDKLEHTLHCQVFPANYLSPIGLSQVHSQNPAICKKTSQDSFDSIGKLETLRKSGEKHGVSIVINTDTDTTIHNRSHFRLASGLDKVSQKTFPILFNHPDKHKNGHSFDILSDPQIWKKTLTFITAKDYPEILDTSGGWKSYLPIFLR